jgi:hypothetical protein
MTQINITLDSNVLKGLFTVGRIKQEILRFGYSIVPLLMNSGYRIKQLVLIMANPHCFHHVDS